MRMWVFRKPNKGGGKPTGTCPVEINSTAIHTGFRGPIQRINYEDENVSDFFISELFDYGRLRQGWGVPTLDLRLNDQAWIENYIIACYRYWGEETDCALAHARRRILIKMVLMEVDDYIFLPNVGEAEPDGNSFCLCHVTDRYFFEDRSYLGNTWEKDFAHVIPVQIDQVFNYSSNTLPKALFGAPYMHAIDEIEQHHQKYTTFQDFIRSLQHVR